jgi:metal-responsive CopG/Arc/MetJ family transcriptional regulator
VFRIFDKAYLWLYLMCMKIVVFIPDSIFKAAEKMAPSLGLSRSEIYAKAVAEYLQKYRNDGVTKKLVEIYSKESSQLDPGINALQSASINEDDFDWTSS